MRNFSPVGSSITRGGSPSFPKRTSVRSGMNSPALAWRTMALAVDFTRRTSPAIMAEFRRELKSTPPLCSAITPGISSSIILSQSSSVMARISFSTAISTKASRALWQKLPSSTLRSLYSLRSSACRPFSTKWRKGQALNLSSLVAEPIMRSPYSLKESSWPKGSGEQR